MSTDKRFRGRWPFGDDYTAYQTWRTRLEGGGGGGGGPYPLDYYLSVQGIDTGETAPRMIICEAGASFPTTPTSLTSTAMLSGTVDFVANDTSYDISTGKFFAGGGVEAASSGKLYRSTQTAGTMPAIDEWEDISANLNSSGTFILSVLAREGTVIVTGANGYVEVSMDGGDSFAVPTLTGKSGASVIEGLSWDAATGYFYILQFSASYLLWESQDSGATWSVYGAGGGTAPTSSYAICVHNGTALAGAGFGGLRRSTDGGDTWSSVAAFGLGSDVHHIDTDGAGNWQVVERFGNGISYSTDDGANWSNIYGWGAAAQWITGVAYLQDRGWAQIYRQSSGVPTFLAGAVSGTGNKTITDNQITLKNNLQSGIAAANYPTS